MKIKGLFCAIIAAALALPSISLSALASGDDYYGYSNTEAVSLMKTEPGIETPAMSCETWYPYEISLTAQNVYDEPFYDVDVDCVFLNTKSGEVLTIPAFWNGETAGKSGSL
jgi:hypothetical protein